MVNIEFNMILFEYIKKKKTSFCLRKIDEASKIVEDLSSYSLMLLPSLSSLLVFSPCGPILGPHFSSKNNIFLYEA